MQISETPVVKHRALLRITFERLHDLLGLPADISIYDVFPDASTREIVMIKVTGDRLPAVPQGQAFPEYDHITEIGDLE